MGFEIIYQSAFVLAGEYIVPLVLAGSNNCYEMTWQERERRERNWVTLNLPTYKKEELLADIDARPERYEAESLRINGKFVGKGYGHWLKSNINRALSLDDIYANNVDFPPIELYKNNATTTFVKTNDELVKALKDVAYSNPIVIRVKYKSTIKKPVVGPVVVKYKKLYLCEFEQNKSARYGAKWQDAIVFDSIDDANKKVGKLLLQGCHFCRAKKS